MVIAPPSALMPCAELKLAAVRLPATTAFPPMPRLLLNIESPVTLVPPASTWTVPVNSCSQLGRAFPTCADVTCAPATPRPAACVPRPANETNSPATCKPSPMVSSIKPLVVIAWPMAGLARPSHNAWRMSRLLRCGFSGRSRPQLAIAAVCGRLRLDAVPCCWVADRVAGAAHAAARRSRWWAMAKIA